MASRGRFLIDNKVGCVHPMVILFEFRIGSHRVRIGSHFVCDNLSWFVIINSIRDIVDVGMKRFSCKTLKFSPIM